MASAFKGILGEVSEMFNIAMQMAEEEANEPERREVLMASLMELARSCRVLVVVAKARAEEETTH